MKLGRAHGGKQAGASPPQIRQKKRGFCLVLTDLVCQALGLTTKLMILPGTQISLMTFTVTVITKGNEATTWFILLQIVGHILIIFGILVYNELMIVHVCGMDENTNKEIQGRATKETKEGEGDVSLLPVEERSNSVSTLPEKDNPAYNNSLC